MNIQNQFTFYHFIIFSTILLVVNFMLIKFKKSNWRNFVSWKVISLAFIFTFLGLFYSETSYSKEWIVITYGFPECFYLEKKPFGEPICVEFFIQEFKYLNFIQNFVLFFLLLKMIKTIFKKNLK